MNKFSMKDIVANTERQRKSRKKIFDDLKKLPSDTSEYKYVWQTKTINQPKEEGKCG